MPLCSRFAPDTSISRVALVNVMPTCDKYFPELASHRLQLIHHLILCPGRGQPSALPLTGNVSLSSLQKRMGCLHGLVYVRSREPTPNSFRSNAPPPFLTSVSRKIGVVQQHCELRNVIIGRMTYNVRNANGPTNTESSSVASSSVVCSEDSGSLAPFSSGQD